MVQQTIVYEAIKRLLSCSNAEIARFLGWGINRVTPRVHELRKMDQVYFDKLKSCDVTGRTVNAWRVR